MTIKEMVLEMALKLPEKEQSWVAMKILGMNPALKISIDTIDTIDSKDSVISKVNLSQSPIYTGDERGTGGEKNQNPSQQPSLFLPGLEPEKSSESLDTAENGRECPSKPFLGSEATETRVEGDKAAEERAKALLAANIYDAYPRKAGRRAAIASIIKAMSIVDGGKLLAAVREYASAIEKWSQDDRKYVPMATTWFNQGRWDDDRAEWSRNSGGAGENHSAARDWESDGGLRKAATI